MMTTPYKRPAFTLMELIVVLLIVVALAGIAVPLVSFTIDDTRQNQITPVSLNVLRDAILAYHRDMNGVEVLKNTSDVAGPSDLSNKTGIPYSLKYLLRAPTVAAGNPSSIDPITRRGWNGPYVLQSTGRFDTINLDATFLGYGNQDDPTFLDAWGNPIVLQWPNTLDSMDERARYVRLVSGGAPSKLLGSKYVSTIDTLNTSKMPTKPTTALPSLPNERGNDMVLFIRVQDDYP